MSSIIGELVFKVSDSVETKISEKLPDSFALVFDIWSHGTTRYVVSFPSCVQENASCREDALFELLPLENEADTGAFEHKNLLEFVLSVYNKGICNAVALIGDNVSTTKSLSFLCGCRFVGCASHRVNLAVKDIWDGNSDLIDDIDMIMPKLRPLIPAARMRQFSSLKPLVNSLTMWGSTLTMRERYIKLKEFIPKLEIDKISLRLPSNADEISIGHLMAILQDFESVFRSLPEYSTRLAEVIVMFESIAAK